MNHFMPNHSNWLHLHLRHLFTSQGLTYPEMFKNGTVCLCHIISKVCHCSVLPIKTIVLNKIPWLLLWTTKEMWANIFHVLLWLFFPFKLTSWCFFQSQRREEKRRVEKQSNIQCSWGPMSVHQNTQCGSFLFIIGHDSCNFQNCWEKTSLESS